MRPRPGRTHGSDRLVAPTLVALALVVLGGCGGGGDKTDAKAGKTPEPSSEATDASPPSASPSPLKTEQPQVPPRIGELRAAVQSYSNAYLTGDVVGSRSLLSERCKIRVGPGEWAAAVKVAGQKYGNALPIDAYDAQVSGDVARVSYTFTVAALDQSRQRWVHEGGRWHDDGC